MEECLSSVYKTPCLLPRTEERKERNKGQRRKERKRGKEGGREGRELGEAQRVRAGIQTQALLSQDSLPVTSDCAAGRNQEGFVIWSVSTKLQSHPLSLTAHLYLEHHGHLGNVTGGPGRGERKDSK